MNILDEIELLKKTLPSSRKDDCIELINLVIELQLRKIINYKSEGKYIVDKSSEEAMHNLIELIRLKKMQ